jgi:hypothetical protein
MVLMNSSKMARNSASIINRPTCGGGAKKNGTASSIGNVLMSSNLKLARAVRCNVTMCIVSANRPTQRTGYSATHSGMMG